MPIASTACSTGSTISASPWSRATRSRTSSRSRRPRAPGRDHPCARLRRLDVGDLIEAGLRLLDQLAEARPFLAELGRMVRSLELLTIGPLHVVHDVAAVLALVQADRHETRLPGHEP